MNTFIKQKKEYLFIAIYFFFLLPIYLDSWVVPDFRAYSGFAQTGLTAKDGFSTLFLFIAGLSTITPKLICILCLFLLCLGMISFIYFYNENIDDKLPLIFKNLFIITLFSDGIWYYFYGKIFYEFPFIIGNYGICLVLMSKVYKDYYKNNKIDYKLYYLLFSIGLCISWKIHSMFLILGTFLIICCNDSWRKIVIYIISSISRTLKSILCICSGYILGNYGVLIDFKDTLQGLQAYPAKSEFLKRLFDMDFIVWDHVNLMPWNISTLNILTCIWIGIIIPILIKKYRYILSTLTIIIIFIFISSNKTYGFTWQAFPVGAFFLILFLFLLLEINTIGDKHKKILCIGMIIVSGIQMLVTLGFYIPKQIQWYKNTQVAIAKLVENEEEIRRDTIEFISLIDEHTFGVNIALKRLHPVESSTVILNTPSRANPYIVSVNKEYADPLAYSNLDVWNGIYKSEKFRNYLLPECEYMIYIIPNNFKIMNDVADINYYLNLPSIKSYNRKEYSIKLIKIERSS